MWHYEPLESPCSIAERPSSCRPLLPACLPACLQVAVTLPQHARLQDGLQQGGRPGRHCARPGLGGRWAGVGVGGGRGLLRGAGEGSRRPGVSPAPL